jgi:hypothetical protein
LPSLNESSTPETLLSSLQLSGTAPSLPMTVFPQNQRTLCSIPVVLFRPQTNAITTKSFKPRPSDTVFHARLHYHSASVHELTPLLPRPPFIGKEDSKNCQRCGIPSATVWKLDVSDFQTALAKPHSQKCSCSPIQPKEEADYSRKTADCSFCPTNQLCYRRL